MIDLTGKLLIELRDDYYVDAIVDGRVRVFEPAPGDAKAAGSYQAFIVISTLATPPDRRLPIQRPTYAVRCYAATPQAAMALYVACSNAIHDIGPRVHSNGAGIYGSFDVSGGTPDRDPDTRQPLVEFVVAFTGTTQVVV